MVARNDTGVGRTWFVRYAAGVNEALRHLLTGGEAAGTTARVLVEDLHIAGASGKVINRTVPLMAATGDIGTQVSDITQTSEPMYNVVKLRPFETDGNTTVAQMFFNGRVLDRNAILANDVLRMRTHFELKTVDGNQLDYVRIEVSSSSTAGSGTVIFDSGALAAPGVGDYAYVQFDMVIDAVGNAGTLIVNTLRCDDGAGSAWVTTTRGTVVKDGVSQSVTVDTTADWFINVYSKWGTASAAQSISAEHIEIERVRRDLWFYDADLTEERFLLPVGDGRHLDIPLVLDQAHGHQIIDARIYAGVENATGGSDELEIDLVEYDPSTDVETSLLAATVINASAGGWSTLTPAADEDIEDAKRYFIRVVSKHQTTSGTNPRFWVSSAECTTRMQQLH